MLRRPVTPAVLLCALLAAPAAHAGLFDDGEARQQITDLKTQYEQRFDTQAQAQLELATQILGLREEIARLRGQVETLTYENEQSKKRQQDLYLDLDSRLRRLEPNPPAAAAAPGEGAGNGQQQAAQHATTADPAAEAKEYEAALNLFRAGKYKEAATAFENIVAAHPDSDVAPNAQFWLGNAWYAQKQCKQAIDAQLVVTTRWPDSTRAPDAMIAIANCQRDWGNIQAAKRTLGNVVSKYPDSKAATEARQRLGIK